jgi:two-component system chemotaxis response regulator CheB
MNIIQLKIGELAVSESPAVISTILGSCVSVCVYSSCGVGGMIHFALPRREKTSDPADELKYGEIALPRLIEEVGARSGKSTASLSAKVVGGAAVVRELQQGAQIGPLNVALAEKILAQSGVAVMGRDVGGNEGRKVLFYTHSGRLRVAPIEIRGNEGRKPPEFPVIEKAQAALRAASSGKKRVLIVDDSKTIQDLLSRILAEDSRIEVVGVAPDPIVAERMINELKPDVITLDVHMPEMDGVTFLAKFLPKKKIPVVMITSISMEESDHVFRALELGAVDYVQKPSMKELKNMAPVIRDKVHAASLVKKIRIASGKGKSRLTALGGATGASLLAIGASTGGTEALKDVLVRLPKDVPPIVIVQHIPPVFSKAFAKRLNELCAFEVKEAENGDEIRPRRALVAPGGCQMKVEPSGSGFKIRITDDPPVSRHKPSVDYLFHSVAKLFGRNAIGVILTGMGSDGADGLLKMRQAGARTLGQDEESCVVYGMPRVAAELGAVQSVHSLEDIPDALIQLFAKKGAA